jgi:hypothetical protein
MMKHANGIVLSVDGTPEDNYERLRQYLSANGYDMHISNRSSYSLETAYKQLQPTADNTQKTFFRLYANIADSAIYLRGYVSDNNVESANVTYTGDRSSLVGMGWTRLVELAEGFPNDGIAYSRNIARRYGDYGNN